LPGAALLLLRLAFGVALWRSGMECSSSGQAGLAVAMYVAGGFLAIGFLSPLASLLGGIAEVAAPMLSAATPPEARSYLAWAVLLGIVFLGPGALSIDARLFGRREIIIPPSHSELGHQ
jgi:uncharacterized membrane protein YphA (DoxX/SURF4 family)